MTFVQIIDCKTDKIDAMNRLLDAWLEQTKGKRTANHSIIGKDRFDASHVVEIVEFPSYAEAMRNSQLPETDRIFQEMAALCEETPTFTDLDVFRDELPNKVIARRFFQEAVNGRNLDVIGELFASDYQDHDPANEEDISGSAGVRRQYSSYLAAFDLVFTIDGQVAEGDLVTTRTTCTATHIGEFMGVPPSGKQITTTAHTTHRFRDGKIVEGWSNWDNHGLLRQLGLIGF